MSKWMREALAEAAAGVAAGHGGPFGAVVVKDGAVVGRGHNEVLHRNDPTAHAEMQAIREACAFLGSYSLEGCTLYATCQPCPMCLAAIQCPASRRYNEAPGLVTRRRIQDGID